MNDAKAALAGKIMAIKKKKKLTWAKIAEKVGMSPVWTTAALMGQMSMLEPQAKAAAKELGLNADESVRRVSDPLAVAEAGAADLLVIKAQPLGGIRRALRIIDRAGLPVVVSSALDTSIGLAMGAHLAASVPELDYDCGLGTASLLAADVTRAPLLPEDGSIAVRRVVPDPELLDRYAADEAHTDWWLERLGRAYAVLADGSAVE